MSNRTTLMALIKEGVERRQSPAEIALRIELALDLDRGNTFGEVWRDQDRLVVDVGDGLVAESGPPPVAPSADWTLLFSPDREAAQ